MWVRWSEGAGMGEGCVTVKEVGEEEVCEGGGVCVCVSV